MTRGPLLALKVEVKEQCIRADLAYRHLEQLLEVKRINYYPDEGGGVGQAFIPYFIDIWSSIHTILSAAGIISRILWPKPPSDTPPRTPRETRQRERDLAARERARGIWRSWGLPDPKLLKVLTDASVRNAIEHVENGAAEWMADQGWEDKVQASGIGVKGPSGKPDPARQAFRYLFRDTLRVKVGADSCDLRLIIGAIRRIEQSLPIEMNVEVSGIEFVPIARGSKPEGIHHEPA